jgi:hypothetical protein
MKTIVIVILKNYLKRVTMIFIFNQVLENGVVTPLVLQQNSKEIKKIYFTRIYKTETNNHNDKVLYAPFCELYKEVIIIETIMGKIEIEFMDRSSVKDAMKYLGEKMLRISDYDSDHKNFYTKDI